jgi:CheY-like chemotaxis protein
MAPAVPLPEAECDVLLVEDDDDTREALTEILASAGYRARGARSGAEATQILDSLAAPPRLALVDVVMPEMSGIEWINLARERPELRDTRLVVLSGLAPPADRRPPPGVDAWMVKPPRIEPLLEMVERLLRTPKSR